jgi:hypothetical protein
MGCEGELEERVVTDKTSDKLSSMLRYGGWASEYKMKCWKRKMPSKIRLMSPRKLNNT